MVCRVIFMSTPTLCWVELGLWQKSVCSPLNSQSMFTLITSNEDLMRMQVKTIQYLNIFLHQIYFIFFSDFHFLSHNSINISFKQFYCEQPFVNTWIILDRGKRWEITKCSSTTFSFQVNFELSQPQPQKQQQQW